MKTLCDHPMLMGQILARTEARKTRDFARRHRRAAIVDALLPYVLTLASVLAFVGTVWLGLAFSRLLP